MKRAFFVRRLASLAAAMVAACAAGTARADDIPIYTLQGSGATSPYVGQHVTTTGVVTKQNSNGFFIQDLAGDGNPATSDGIFVFSSQYHPAVGSLVRVAATVQEFNVGAASNANTASQPLTELSSVSAVTTLGTGYSMAPTPIVLPLAEGDGFERFEGMLVTVAGPLTVQQNYFQARYGEITVGAGGRHETPTNKYRPGTPQAVALAGLQARGRLLLDDGSATQNPNPTPYAGDNGVPRAGDTVGAITGVIDFGLSTSSNADPGLYRIHPTAVPTITLTNPRPAVPAVAGNVKLASMNVLNFFTTFTNGQTAGGQTGQGCSLGGSVSAGNCRGADNLAEFLRQRAKLVLAINALDADAVGLMEIQNNGAVAAQNLVDALNAAAGATTWAVVSDPPQGTGTDAIKVAMIYKPARLAPAGAAVSDPAEINNRPPLGQTFVAANGERFTLVVNHLKSKSSCPAAGDPEAAGNTDAGDGQGCWNARRVLQAQRLRTFVAQLQQLSGSADVLLIGDFNAYAQEDPVYELTSNGYVDESGRHEAFGYSYVFDGASGRLDDAIATAAFSPKVSGAVHWHIDADESVAQDYNLEFKQPACPACAPDPYNAGVPGRASDHDPVLVGAQIWKRIDGTAGRDVLAGSPGDDILTGGPGADVLTGGAGTNVYAYESLRDVGDSVTDYVIGKDRIDVSALLAGLGWTGNDPVAEGWMRFAAVPGGAAVQIDSDGPAGPAVFRTIATLQGVNAADLSVKHDLLLRPMFGAAIGGKR